MNNTKTKITNELGLIDKLYQKTVVKKIKDTDWKKGSSGPIVVEFDPTTACNLACPDCISRELINQGFFSRERIHDLTKEMVDAGVKAVVLIGGGEPLIHPEIGWVIEYLGKNGVQVGITTNGILIDKYIGVISEYATWVRVSVDAGTSETFNKIRPSRSGQSQFLNIIDNMKKLAKVKKGRLGYSFMLYTPGKFDRPLITDSLNDYDSMMKLSRQKDQLKDEAKVSTFTNADEIYKGALLAKEIGCDYFEIKPMYDIHHFAISQDKGLIETIMNQIDESLKLSDDTFRVLRATKLRNTLSGNDEVEKKNYNRCVVAELRTLVTPSGVYVCPYFRGREDKCIGDVKKSSFLDMWNGIQRKNVMQTVDPSKVCKMHCIRHDSNMMLEDMISGKEFTITDDFDLFI